MIPTFISRPAPPFERGAEFGSAHVKQIRRNIERYQRLFRLNGQVDQSAIASIAAEFIDNIEAFSPELMLELRGIACGAAIAIEDVVTLNARTEILALSGTMAPQECSVLIQLPRSGQSEIIAVQSWDWLSEFADGWLLWTIETPHGHTIKTLTEFGILGKIGVNSTGVGLLINILSHRQDGRTPVGLPVHVAARAILDASVNIHHVTMQLAAQRWTASSALSVVMKEDGHAAAFSMELFPGGPAFHMPDPSGLLVHSNHFLSDRAVKDDRAPFYGSSSFVRFDVLKRGMVQQETHTLAQAVTLFASHLGGAHALCSHPLPNATDMQRSETLALVKLDPNACELAAREGGGCAIGDWTVV